MFIKLKVQFAQVALYYAIHGFQEMNSCHRTYNFNKSFDTNIL